MLLFFETPVYSSYVTTGLKKIQNVITEACGPKRKPDLDRGDILIS